MHTRMLVFLFCIALLITVGIAVTKPYAYLAPDSFTYFTLVKQFWNEGMFMSYTGINHTTGIHLGYYLLLLPFFPLFSMTIPAWSFIINGVLIAGSLFVLYRALGTLPIFVIGAILVSPYGMQLTNNGMESALLFFTLSLTTLFFYKNGTAREFPSEPKYTYLFGILLGAVIIARLDSILIVGPIGFGALTILFLHSHSLRQVIGFSLRATLPFLLIAVSIFMVNMYYGGAPLPVSGSIKSSFPEISSLWFSTILTLKIFILSLMTLLFVSGVHYVKTKRIDYYLAALLVGCGALTLYNALFASGIGAWYGTAPFFATLVALGLFIKMLDHYVPGYIVVSASVLLMVVSVALHTTVSTDDWVTPHQDAAVVYETTLRKETETAGELKDGVFAFYADSPVYSLTGLANNQEYVTAIESGGVETYLHDTNIKFIVGGETFSGVQVPGGEHWFAVCTNPLFDNGYVRIYPTGNCLEK